MIREDASIDMKLIDTHCDTAFELYKKNESIVSNTCDISLDKASIFSNYTQFFAIWADKRKSDDEAYADFLSISDYFKKDVDAHSEKIELVRSFHEMENAWNNNKVAAFLAVEDARILANDIKRLDVLHERGVKYLTLMWGKNTCIGASHDAEGGLTDFGKEVVKRCFELSIIPDVSHANAQTTSDILNIAMEYNKPVIATHSNCYSLYPHTRNLRSEHLDMIKELQGIVGISLCPSHLTDTSLCNCDVRNVCDHIEKYLELGAVDILGLGCDLDGTSLPFGFHGVDSLPLICDELSDRGIKKEITDKIFYKNYYDFIKRNM